MKTKPDGDGAGTLLEPYRVLDLTDEKGFLCGKMLADMGADVIKIEPPGGDPSRLLGPHYHDEVDPEKSLYWLAYNANKRSITLDLETTAGRDAFRQLATTADVVVESFRPGYLGALRLGPGDLGEINPGLVFVSITPFGQSGPYVEQAYEVNDMILWALGGFMFPNGDPDRPPNQLSFPQAYLHGGAEAAAGAMVALYARESTGRGQHVDVSIQQSIHTSTQLMLPTWDMYRRVIPRGTGKRGLPKPDGTILNSRSTYECKDGLFYLILGGGALRAMALSSRALIELIDEEGTAGDMTGYDWSKFDYRTVTQEEMDHIQLDIIAPFIRRHTKAELYEECIKRKILGCPFQDPRDVAESPQLAARKFFVRVDHPELDDTLTYCGPFIQLSETPLGPWRRAPLIGEHNREVLEPHHAASSPAADGAPAPEAEAHEMTVRAAPRTPERGIFEGTKILDFTSGAVGPLTVRYLSDHGATAVHVESRLRPDVTRTAGPFRDRLPELDRSAWQPNYNAGKYGFSLNMDLPRAREIAWKLIDWCDVIAEGYTPGVMKRWGMDYEAVRQIKPDIIYFSTCQQGQYGPHADFRGYGVHAAAVAGMCHMMGWPDREPVQIFGAYTDFISPRFGGSALIAALDYRRRTGRGQHIDLAQFEAGVTFLAPVIMDYFANGRIQTRNGNRMPDAAPHNAYACVGDDRWVAIAVTDENQWRAFRRAIGDPGWAALPRFRTLAGRKEHEEELDRLVSGWTSRRSAEEAMTHLQAAGVPAGLVANEQDIWNDPQLKHRKHFRIMEHSVIGPHTYDSIAFKLSESSQGPRWAGPALGQHVDVVCREFLGMSEDELADCFAEGVFE